MRRGRLSDLYRLSDSVEGFWSRFGNEEVAVRSGLYPPTR